MKEIVLQNGRLISEKAKPFFIGEIGINHNGDIKIAKKLIDMASEIGIDSIKFQKRDYKNTITEELLSKDYNYDNSFGKTYGEHKKFLEFSDESLRQLFKYATQKKLIPCCSAFDIRSYDFIESNLNPLFHKIPSPLVVNHAVLKHVSRYGKPIFMATGMCSLKEVDMAVEVITEINKDLIVMQCTSIYPTENHEVDLAVIKLFRSRYKLLTGFSSHDKTVVFPAVAYALGACVFEKHITLDRSMKGPDHSSSFEKRGLELAYNYLLATYDAMGDGNKKIQKRELVSRNKHLQSIVAARDITAGKLLRLSDIKFKSPGTGLCPFEIDKILNKKLKVNIKKDELILLDKLT